MKQSALTILAIVFATLALNSAQAASCGKSRDYLLGDLAGDLPEPPQAYQDLFKMCMATTAMSNVKDAFILKDGGIAVTVKQDSVAATAGTLSTFCTAYPRGTLRFITRKELPQAKSIGQVVLMSSTSSTPCRKIMGNSSS